MTITPSIPSATIDLTSTWEDDVVDLTDRRRLLLQAVFGVDVPRRLVDEVFEVAARAPQSPATSSASSTSSAGSTTRRSGGRSSSTVAR